MIKVFLQVIFFFLTTLNLYAQGLTPEWGRSLSSANSETVFATAIDAQGNVYSFGAFTGTVDFDPGDDVYNLSRQHTTGNDLFIQKLDSNGNFVWAKQIVSAQQGSFNVDISNIKIDANNNVYLSGSHRSTADFDPGVETVIAGAHDYITGFILKLDAAGNYSWVKSLQTTSSLNAQALALDPAGNVVVSGTFAGSGDFDPGPGTATVTGPVNGAPVAFVTKFTSSGDFVWVKTLGSTLTIAGKAIATDFAGNVFIAGNYGGATSGIATLNSAGMRDVFVCKLNPSGTLIWSKSVGGTQSDLVNSIAVDATGKVLITGSFEGTVDFDPGPGVSNLVSSGGADIFILKLTNSGNYVWAKGFGSTGFNSYDNGAAIETDASGAVMVAGTCQGQADFDPSAEGVFILNVNGCFLIKLSEAGGFMDALNVGDQVNPYSISIGFTPNVVIGGAYYSTFSVIPGAPLTFGGGGRDGFVAKYKQNIPSVATDGASAVNEMSAQLNAIVNGNGIVSQISFEYSNNSDMSDSIAILPTTNSSTSAGSGQIKPTAVITGLKTGTTYYFRVKATTTFGTFYGNVKSFFVPFTPPGNALHFDGTNDYVQATSVTYPGANLTIEAWIKTTSASGTKEIVSYGGQYQDILEFRIVNGKLSCGMRGSNGTWAEVVSSAMVNTGRWTHVAVSKNGSAYALYINGVLEKTMNNTQNNPNINRLTIGHCFYNNSLLSGYNFPGSIDEVRIWNVARTAAEIAGNMNRMVDHSTSGLFVYYSFDQGAANSANTGLTTLTEAKGKNATLYNFGLNGVASNWVESYAMVVPAVQPAIEIYGNSFIASWSVPETGTADDYLLYVSTDSEFGSFVPGYNGLSVTGTSKMVTGTSINTTYYYRVAANKTSVNQQGGFSAKQLVLSTSVLPLKLLSFTGKAVNGQSQLQWQTATEVNTAGFVVETSVDGGSFTPLGTVKAAQNSTTPRQYNFAHPKPATGHNFYRLKMVDADGTATHSAIIMVTFSGKPQQVHVYPAPARNQVFIDLPNAPQKPVQYSIFNNAGVIVQSGILRKKTESLNVTALPGGLYHIRLSNGQSATIVKQ